MAGTPSGLLCRTSASSDVIQCSRDARGCNYGPRHMELMVAAQQKAAELVVGCLTGIG
ncbi:hypothetical protein C1H46_034146 [Malus baccata]|uniref:Uncharacterized protein n=1 Tax=Malus baccata TaxID=106549 RepID=A0A540L1E6_MALBA|nr:hypothetical protein C1H46_034146 [Malus baccata]